MISEKVALYFKQGSSDKVYHASIEEAGHNNFVVNFAFGRRGSTLKTGTKTKTAVDYDSAKKIYEKLVKSKIAEGYIIGAEGTHYTNADTQDMGIQCQLLNFIEESEVAQFIHDDAWWAQEKYDGKRMLIQKTDTVTAINRKGSSVGAPEPILQSAEAVSPTYLIDGEAVGETLFAFDLLEIDGKNIRAMAYSQRLLQLEKLGVQGSIIVVETAKTAQEKTQLYDRLRTSNGEGMVFKKHTAPYTAGRPNSGGTQVKFKFYATLSAVVTKINEARSVAVALFDGGALMGVGNVTIPPNKEIPAVNAIIEVRYLYAYPGGSLYQPTYIGVREDLRAEDCVSSQLKYKRESE